jgi:hypothetical protein
MDIDEKDKKRYSFVRYWAVEIFPSMRKTPDFGTHLCALPPRGSKFRCSDPMLDALQYKVASISTRGQQMSKRYMKERYLQLRYTRSSMYLLGGNGLVTLC